MRSLLVLSILSIIALASDAGAAESAATSQLPAALQAASVAPTQVLTANNANEVRGQVFWLNAKGFANSAVFQGGLQMNGAFMLTNIQVSPYRVFVYGY